MPENDAKSYIESLIKPVGLPIAYRQFEKYKDKPIPNLPYLIYTLQSNAGGADDKNLFIKHRVTVELYTERKDFELEYKVEAALETVQWTKDEDYIESEALNMVTYEFEIFEKLGGKNNGKKQH